MDSVDAELAAFCRRGEPVGIESRFAVGQSFGPWVITGFLARGGHAEVYCARHAHLGTAAALKVLHRTEARARARFRREAEFLADNSSPAFPRYLDYGEDHGVPFLAMELLRSGELPRTDAAVARFILDVCDGVADLHRRGLIHRDLKPANILFRPLERQGGDDGVGRPVIADLGLLKSVATVPEEERPRHDAPPTRETFGAGTPGYGAPEQFQEGELSPAVDVHALGVLADACFDGRPPTSWMHIIRMATSSLPGKRHESVAAFARAVRWRRTPRLVVVGFLMTALLAVGWALVGKPPPSQQERVPPHETASSGFATPSARPVASPILPSPGDVPADDGMPDFPQELDLGGEKRIWPGTVVLKPGVTYHVRGPGILDAAVSGPTNASMVLETCVFLNRTSVDFPSNGVHYVLEDGVYLNFVNLDRPARLFRHRVAPYDSSRSEVGFRGPETLREFRRQQTRGILSPSERF